MDNQFTIAYGDNKSISYVLTRSKRKTLALTVRNGLIEARAPLRMPKGVIDDFVLSKVKWLDEKLQLLNKNAQERKTFNLSYGDVVIYQGLEYPIVARNGNRIGFDDEGFYMPSDLSPDEIKQACVAIYRMLAKRDLTNKTLDFAKLMSVSPTAIKVNNANTRWGSCSAKKSINYSWKLIMADDDVIDYVVVHELAHLIEMNHSAKFWSVVGNFIPDYKNCRQRLKDLQKRLICENWDI